MNKNIVNEKKQKKLTPDSFQFLEFKSLFRYITKKMTNITKQMKYLLGPTQVFLFILVVASNVTLWLFFQIQKSPSLTFLKSMLLMAIPPVLFGKILLFLFNNP